MSYPPPNNQYPPQQGGYPPQQGYPQQGGYPPQQGGYPPQQQYPPQQGGYPPQQGGYPPQPQQTGYPPQQGGYPPQQQYPPQGGFQPTYPPQQGGYPPQQGGYPPQQGGYPPQQTGYPPQQGGYPPQQGGYPPQQTGYPPQQGGYPPQQTGYPPQQGGFPPQQGGYQQFPQQGQPIASYYITAPIMQIPPYNGEPDAEALYKAMKGLGTNDGVLSNIVATRTRDQLQEIKRVFERKYGKTLEHWIKGETSGHYEDLLISLIDEKAEYDAKLIKSAVKGLGTNDGQLIETICTRNNGELRAMKLAYQKLYHVDVEKDVNDDTSGDYRKLLLAILRADRPEAQPVNIEDAKRDAQRLYQAGEGKIGTDEATFVEILSQRSLPQLQTIANCYASITNHSLESGISKETSGNFKKAMIVLITPKDEYFAQSIRTAIEGSGTNDKALIRCLSYISTNKDLMRAVNQFYTHRWKHNLMNDVGGDTSGWYKKTAQAVIGNRVNL